MKSAKFVPALAVAALLGGSLAAAAQTGPADGPRAEPPRPRMESPLAGPMGLDWATADANKDGKIDAAEVNAALKARFDKADTDGNGQLSAEELAAAIKAMEEERADARRLEMAKRLIDRADDNGDGTASADEMRLPRGGDDFVKRFDTDNDGTVTQAEYDAAMKAMHDRMDRSKTRDGKDHDGKRGKGRHGAEHGERGPQGKGGHRAEPAPAAPPAAPAQ